MRLIPSNAAKRVTLDELAKVLQRPSAAPTMAPEEVIAVTLNFIHWKPEGRPLGPKDNVVFQIVRALRQCGYSIVPTEAKREEDTETSS